MKRASAAAFLLTALVAFLGAVGAVPAPRPAAGAAPNVNFAAPKKASADNMGIGRIAASSLDGSADILAIGGTTLEVEYNPSFYGDFSATPLDVGDAGIGNQVAHHGADGRIWGEWFRGYSDGTADIISSLKSPGSGGSAWHNTIIPGSHGTYKVTDEAVQPGTNRVYALWARNNVGARIAYSDNGTNWSAAEDVPGPFSSSAADFAIGVSKDGVVAVGWFERSPSDDLLVQMKTGGVWGPVTDVAPLAGQAYGPRFAGDLSGGLRVVWDQVTGGERDPWYREWTPGSGWGAMVQLCNTPGDTSGGAYNISVDPSGIAHIVYGDDSIAPGDQQSFYVEGRGTSFSSPQAVVPFGSASSRFPDIDVNTVSGSVVAHVVVNSNVGGSFANYYTYANLGPPPTPTPMPTPCTPGVFSDVTPSNPFYNVIHDLVGRGAISGYSDCTFRPYNTITRGQSSKVLVLGFGLPINTSGGPHFSDVPLGAPFYNYVETAYNAGIISGYNDGTFRPNANVTRAQISKMVAIGRGWALINPTTPTFSDVPRSNPFYQVIETAYSKGVISGYTCGTGCLQFRPYNTATRGQGAKIIDLAIYAAARP